MIGSDIKSVFSSSGGWQLSLPGGWKVLPKSPLERADALDLVEVFSHPYDPSLSITWMRSSSELSLRAWQSFLDVTIEEGAIEPQVAHEVISTVFPLMGRTVSAFAISLPAGMRALELTEEISTQGSSSEPMRGYHLLLPVATSENRPLFLQQFVFYARLSKFAQEIVEVIKAARSFRQGQMLRK